MIEIVVKKGKPKKSVVFDTYWKFAAERQRIFFNRIEGKAEPWTNDEILHKHKFTNTYRASDRVSQFLIREVIYGVDFSPKDVFFRIILFKTFNKIETWQHLEKRLGRINLETYSFKKYSRILDELIIAGKSIYSGAYIMTSGKSAFGHSKKYKNHLKLIEFMMSTDLPNKVMSSKSMKDLFDLLKEYPTLGNFLAYQYCIDLNYSELTDFSEMDFVVPGPGAKDGIKKCFTDVNGYSESDIIKYMCDIQQREFDRLEIDFQSLWGRPLQLIDAQNLFCEVDKYSRVVHPSIQGISGRTRIKQVFKKSEEKISFWYPPKWGINDLIL